MAQDKRQTEERFISLLIKHKDLTGEWLDSGIDVNYFEEVHRLILHAITFAFSRDARLTRRTFINYLRVHAPDTNIASSQEHLFNLISMLPVNRDDFQILKEEIVNSYVKRQAISFIDNFRANLQTRSPSKAAEILTKQLTNLTTDSSSGRKIVYEDIIPYHPHFVKSLRKRMEGNGTEIIKSWIDEIDYTTVVGHAPGTLTLFSGDVGGFKSTFMLNVAANVWEFSKKNVLVCPLEMPRNKWYQKFLSRRTKIPFDKFEQPSLFTDNDWNAIENAFAGMEDCQNRFFIMEAPERVSVSVIRREIERNIDIFKPHLVVIDYIANLIPEKGGADRNDLQIGEMLKDLRTMGKPGSVHAEGFATISGAQIGREGLKRIRKMGGKMAFFSEDLRGSHEYSADADNIYVQMEDPSQKGRLQLFVVKSRYGRKTFANGSNRAILEVKPEISLIQSIKNDFLMKKSEKNDALLKVEDSSMDALDLDVDEPDDAKYHDSQDTKGIDITPKIELDDEDVFA